MNALWVGQVVLTKPVPPLWNFGMGSNYGYEYFMQRPDGRILVGTRFQIKSHQIKSPSSHLITLKTTVQLLLMIIFRWG